MIDIIVIIGDIKVLVELFIYLYCLAELFGKKLKLNIYVVVLTIVYMFFAVAIDYSETLTYFVYSLYICIFLYALSYYRESIRRTLVNCLLSVAIMDIFQTIVFLPLYYLYFNKYQQIEVNELLIMLCSFLLIVLCSRKIKFKKLSDFCVKRNGLVAGVSISILVGLIISIYQVRGEGGMPSEIYAQMVYFLLIFAFVIYEWQKSRVDAEKQKTQLEMNSLYYDAYDQLIMIVRQRQHDMKSHINTILSMIYTTDDYDELVTKQKEYCGQVMERNEKTKLLLSIENPLIAGFLFSKIQEAEGKGIKVDYKINIKKTTSVIPEYELVEMAGVLIDNAMEALCDADDGVGIEGHAKKIYVSMKETEEDLELIVANTGNYFEEDITSYFFEPGYSSKGKGRGIGLFKLKRMVHERMGEIIVSNETYENDNYLQFGIVIPVKSKGRLNGNFFG